MSGRVRAPDDVEDGGSSGLVREHLAGDRLLQDQLVFGLSYHRTQQVSVLVIRPLASPVPHLTFLLQRGCSFTTLDTGREHDRNNLPALPPREAAVEGSADSSRSVCRNAGGSDHSNRTSRG